MYNIIYVSHERDGIRLCSDTSLLHFSSLFISSSFPRANVNGVNFLSPIRSLGDHEMDGGKTKEISMKNIGKKVLFRIE